MRRIRKLLTATSVCALAIGSMVVSASETQTYTYDELGRLVTVSYAGSINAGNKHSICYDPTDNRTRYRSDPSGAGAVCPTPTPAPTPTPTPSPTPTPTPPNSPPVANTDSISVKVCETGTKNVTANDTDPENDLPLTVTAVSTTSLAQVYIVDGSTIGVTAYGTTGTGSVTYTIKDNRGATASGYLNIAITNGTGCQ